MPNTITVMYDNVDDATFDLDYSMNRHVPLVGEKFEPLGIKGCNKAPVVVIGDLVGVS